MDASRLLAERLEVIAHDSVQHACPPALSVRTRDGRRPTPPLSRTARHSGPTAIDAEHQRVGDDDGGCRGSFCVPDGARGSQNLRCAGRATRRHGATIRTAITTVGEHDGERAMHACAPPAHDHPRLLGAARHHPVAQGR
jgi:hypothetical protein